MITAAKARVSDAELDRERTARLLFDYEVVAGALDRVTLQLALSSPVVRRAVDVGAVPGRPMRVVQQILYKLGKLNYERDVAAPLLAARDALCSHVDTHPRFLVRVDEFPHYRAWDDPQRFGTVVFGRFHEIMHDGGVPYLVAVLPRVSREPLSPVGTESRPLEDGEIQTLKRLGDEQVSFAMHGRDHRTRFASPRRHSELCGLSLSQTEELLDLALQELAGREL